MSAVAAREISILDSPHSRRRAQGGTTPCHTHSSRERAQSNAAMPSRTAAKLIRFRPEELAAVMERARACGTPVAKYIREVAIGVTPRARRTQANAELIQHLARIGNNLNQLAYVANDLGRVGEEARFRAVLDEVVATIKRVE